MTEILPWGQLFATDAAGFIINDCHADKILPPWKALVEELKQACLKVWSNRLQGLYLRGSVPRGLAIRLVSDLDSFAILSGEITDKDITLSWKIGHRLNQRYLFCKKVEIQLLDLSNIQQPDSIWQTVIQTASLKIAGDIKFNFPKFKPGNSPIDYAVTWEADLAKTLDILQKLSPDRLNFSAQVKKQCAWIARRAIRTGFELVMEQDQSYTVDLYYCYERFSAYFPQQQSAMKKTVELALEPSQNRPGLIVFFREFGGWLVSQVRQEFYSSIEAEASTSKIP